MIENALLRRQLTVLNRQVKRPKLTWRDRSIIVFLASKLRGWKDALMIVQQKQPATFALALVRAVHRNGWNFWPGQEWGMDRRVDFLD